MGREDEIALCGGPRVRPTTDYEEIVLQHPSATGREPCKSGGEKRTRVTVRKKDTTRDTSEPISKLGNTKKVKELRLYWCVLLIPVRRKRRSRKKRRKSVKGRSNNSTN